VSQDGGTSLYRGRSTPTTYWPHRRSPPNRRVFCCAHPSQICSRSRASSRSSQLTSGLLCAIEGHRRSARQLCCCGLGEPSVPEDFSKSSSGDHIPERWQGVFDAREVFAAPPRIGSHAAFRLLGASPVGYPRGSCAITKITQLVGTGPTGQSWHSGAGATLPCATRRSVLRMPPLPKPTGRTPNMGVSPAASIHDGTRSPVPMFSMQGGSLENCEKESKA
jgi:hypothetical protein